MWPFKSKEKEPSFADLQRKYEEDCEFSDRMLKAVEDLAKSVKIVCEHLQKKTVPETIGNSHVSETIGNNHVPETIGNNHEPGTICDDYLQAAMRRMKDPMTMTGICPLCLGKGWVSASWGNETCIVCLGTGKVWEVVHGKETLQKD